MTTSLILIGLTAPLMHAADMLPRMRYRKVGGLRFLRVGRFQFSFCKCKESI